MSITLCYDFAAGCNVTSRRTFFMSMVILWDLDCFVCIVDPNGTDCMFSKFCRHSFWILSQNSLGGGGRWEFKEHSASSSCDVSLVNEKGLFFLRQSRSSELWFHQLWPGKECPCSTGNEWEVLQTCQTCSTCLNSHTRVCTLPQHTTLWGKTITPASKPVTKAAFPTTANFVENPWGTFHNAVQI